MQLNMYKIAIKYFFNVSIFYEEVNLILWLPTNLQWKFSLKTKASGWFLEATEKVIWRVLMQSPRDGRH